MNPPVLVTAVLSLVAGLLHLYLGSAAGETMYFVLGAAYLAASILAFAVARATR